MAEGFGEGGGGLGVEKEEEYNVLCPFLSPSPCTAFPSFLRFEKRFLYFGVSKELLPQPISSSI